MKLVGICSLAYTGLAGATNVGSSHVRHSANLSKVISLPRGGAGPLDPTMVAKSSTALSLTNHVLSWLGPARSIGFYGEKAPSPEALMVWQRKDAIFMAGSLTSYLLVFHNKDVNTAIGLGTFPILADLLRSVLNDDEKKIGLSSAGQLLLLMAPFLLTAYACLQNLDNADQIVQLCSAYHGARGLYYLLNPEGACKTWGVTGGGDKTHMALVKWAGVSLIGYALGGTLLAREVDMLKAIGCAWIPFTLYAIYTAFTADEDLNLPAFCAWITLALAVIGTLVF